MFCVFFSERCQGEIQQTDDAISLWSIHPLENERTNVPWKSLVGSDVFFLFENSPFLGDIP